ncbi:MAG: isopeptide-forming domain-containing fimbrial protein, partial [Bacilli bacterium]|nr:isopeptide-forming domain-containing fimbrial protein [Bacilli bacterium]
YGGGGGGGLSGGAEDGGGGSSFISGHAGCIAINEDGTPKVETYSQIEDSYHYSGKVFTDTQMIDGKGYDWTTMRDSLTPMPNPKGGTYNSGVGHAGDGYAIITPIIPPHDKTGLSSLTISGTKNSYTPSFSSTTYEYDLKLAKGEHTITINAVPEEEWSYVTGTGTFSVPKGETDYTVTVLNYDGQLVLYTIHVTSETDATSKEPGYLEDLASAYAGYIKNHPEVVSEELVTSGTTATLSDGDSGSYLILPTSTSRVYAVMVGNIGLTAESGEWVSKNADIVAKVSDASIIKYVGTKSQTEATYSYGDDIPYFIKVGIPRYPASATNKKYEIVDTMDPGLTFK